jgi:hypothetical protein
VVGEDHREFPADVDFLLVNLDGMHALDGERDGGLRGVDCLKTIRNTGFFLGLLWGVTLAWA